LFDVADVVHGEREFDVPEMTRTIDHTRFTRLTQQALVRGPHREIVQTTHFWYIFVVKVGGNHMHDRLFTDVFRARYTELNSLHIRKGDRVRLLETRVHSESVSRFNNVDFL
jgi:hypothetical protein